VAGQEGTIEGGAACQRNAPYAIGGGSSFMVKGEIIGEPKRCQSRSATKESN